jgi:dipeptidyl aminopeptidase/acylaminoacyl peptidase
MTQVILNSLPFHLNEKTVSGYKQSLRIASSFSGDLFMKFHIPFLSAFIVFLLTIFPTDMAKAQEKNLRWTPDVLVKNFNRVGGTAVSPDGNLVAYTVSVPLTEGDKSEYLAQLWMVSAEGKMNRQLTRGEKSSSSPSFSPDGRYLAFLSARSTDGFTQIYLLPLNGGEAEQITFGKSSVNAFAWSPDGSRIAFTMNDPETEEEAKSRRERRDWHVLDTGYKYSHLYTVTTDRDSQGRHAVKRLTSGAFHISGSDVPFDWSPDGKTIVFSHQADTTQDGWWTFDISSVPSDGGVVTELVSWKGMDFAPRYSPDGKWIAFLSDGSVPRWMRYFDVFIIPSRGGEPRKLAALPDVVPQLLIGWSADSRDVFVLEANHTSRRVFTHPVNGDAPQLITSGPGENTDVSLCRRGNVMAFVHQETENPPEIYLSGTTRYKPSRLTDVNAYLEKLPMGKTDVISWKSKDGLAIEGLLTYPVNYVKGRRCPLVLNCHGGPMSFFSQIYTGASTFYLIQPFAQEGYAILQPNPRGSAGYGRDFLLANYNDWGFGDYEDLMSGVDKVIEMGVAHSDSLCVMGWSYGGFMTSFIVTRTKRFKAASEGAGVTNLMSFTGATDIHTFLPDYFGGEFWDRLDTYMKHSAMFNIKGVTTPTQILHGELDKRVPYEQSQELYNALKRQGCPTEMVSYPRVPHNPSPDPKYLIDIGNRQIEWFNKYMRKAE